MFFFDRRTEIIFLMVVILNECQFIFLYHDWVWFFFILEINLMLMCDMRVCLCMRWFIKVRREIDRVVSWHRVWGGWRVSTVNKFIINREMEMIINECSTTFSRIIAFMREISVFDASWDQICQLISVCDIQPFIDDTWYFWQYSTRDIVIVVGEFRKLLTFEMSIKRSILSYEVEIFLCQGGWNIWNKVTSCVVWRTTFLMVIFSYLKGEGERMSMFMYTFFCVY